MDKDINLVESCTHPFKCCDCEEISYLTDSEAFGQQHEGFTCEQCRYCYMMNDLAGQEEEDE